jgi:hypothetical protein
MTRHANILLALTALLLAVGLTGCMSRSTVPDEHDLAIELTRTETGAVDLDALYAAVLPSVQRKLPGAYFRGAEFFTSCKKLAVLDGRLVYNFERVQFGFPRRRVERLSASVRTQDQLMDLWYQDDTDRYPAVKEMTFAGDGGIKEMLAIAQDHLQALGVTQCTMTITQVDSTVWSLSCQDSSNTERVYHFDIRDGVVGDVPPY